MSFASSPSEFPDGQCLFSTRFEKGSGPVHDTFAAQHVGPRRVRCQRLKVLSHSPQREECRGNNNHRERKRLLL
jgi:hypothetical protein